MSAARGLRDAATAGLLVLAALVLTGCGPSYQDLPLPGTSAPDPGYRVTAVFDDALNLEVGAPVKFDGLTVGRVGDVGLRDGKAVASLDLADTASLTTHSQARLRYDTPLGELFVMIDPGDGEGAPVAAGDEIPQRRTSTAATVEDSMAQASLLVNGGGLAQLGTITDELNAAVGGREAELRRVGQRTREVLRTFNQGSSSVDRVLRDLDGLASLLNERRATLHAAVTDLAPAAQVLHEQTAPLVELLNRTRSVTSKANRTVAASQEDLVQVLQQLGPILQQVLLSEPDLLYGFRKLPKVAALLDEAVPGDFMVLDLMLRLEPQVFLGLDGSSSTGSGDGKHGHRHGDVDAPPVRGDLHDVFSGDLPDLSGLASLLRAGAVIAAGTRPEGVLP